LNVSENELTRLDISGNALLEEAHADHNRLGTISLINQPHLKWLDISHNCLPAIDLSGCSALTRLDVSNNRLAGLDISQSHFLKIVDAANNELREYAGHCNDLVFLDLSNNRLETVDINAHQNLVALDVSFNPLTQMEYGDSDLPSLRYLAAFGCRLPLSCLVALGRPWMKVIQFGIQTKVFFEYRALSLDQGAQLDFSGEAWLRVIKTHFFVLDEQGRETPSDCFTEDNGHIKFKKPGKYRILMINRGIPAFSIAQDDDNDFYCPGESRRESFPPDIETECPELSDLYWHYYGYRADETPKQESFVRHPDIMKIVDAPFQVRIHQYLYGGMEGEQRSEVSRLSPKEVQKFNELWPEADTDPELIHYYGFLMYLRGARQYDVLDHARAYTGLIEVVE